MILDDAAIRLTDKSEELTWRASAPGPVSLPIRHNG
jgi:hypothetical protein